MFLTVFHVIQSCICVFYVVILCFYLMSSLSFDPRRFLHGVVDLGTKHRMHIQWSSLVLQIASGSRRILASGQKWEDVQLFAYIMFRRFCTNNCLTLIPPERSVPKGHVCLDKNRCLHNLPLTKGELNSACSTAVSINTRQTVFFGALYMSHCSLTLLAFELAANYSSCSLHVTVMKTVN